MSSILDRRMVYVTGKGGVGRSTVSAALGLAAAAAGKRTIVCEVGEQDRLSRAFKRDRRVGDEQAELADGLCGMSIDPQAALQEFLARLLGSRTLTRLLFESQAFNYLAAAAPGTREIATLGKAAGMAERGEYDLVILDAPASGHGLGMLRTPRTFREIARVGPVRASADKLIGFLSDPERIAYLAVALPEEMPVNETLELERALPDAVDAALAAIVVNGVYPTRFTAEEVELAARVASRDDDAGVRRALAAARTEHRWSSGQQGQLERLRREARAPLVTLPFLFAAQLRRPQLQRLATELAAQL